MKRAHTVKFNDPFGLARANKRKVGSRTVFRWNRRKRVTSRVREEEARHTHTHTHTTHTHNTHTRTPYIHTHICILYRILYMHVQDNAFMSKRANAEVKQARMAETTSGAHRSVTAIHRLGETTDPETPATGSW